MNKFKKFWKEFWQAKHRHAYTHSAEAIRHGNIVQEYLGEQGKENEQKKP